MAKLGGGHSIFGLQYDLPYQFRKMEATFWRKIIKESLFLNNRLLIIFEVVTSSVNYIITGFYNYLLQLFTIDYKKLDNILSHS